MAQYNNKQSKGSLFFKKVKDFIKNTAWLQPLLIVVVIFVVLFSLRPITDGIKKGWNRLTIVNRMEKITYSEYVEKVNSDEDKFVIVFTQKNCDVCPKFYKGVNEYLKSSDYKNGDFKIYNVDLSTKSAKTKIDGTKYKQYKDASCGIVAGAGQSNADIIAKDYIFQLDQRVEDFNSKFENYSYIQTVSAEDTPYTYVSTPLIIWYENGIETKICNTFENQVTFENSKKNSTTPTPKSFRDFISDFYGDYKDVADVWDETFDLTYKK